MANYSVVYVQPDKVSGERLNVAVLCWDETEVRCAMLRNWERCKVFLGDEMRTAVVQQTVEHLTKLTAAELQGGLEKTQEIILDFVKLTTAETTGLPVVSLVAVLAKSHLKDPEALVV